MTSEAPDSGERFSWPPAHVAPGAPVPAIDPLPPAQSPRSVLSRWWRALEDEWLDPVALPLRDRAEAAGWIPDEPGEYCDQCGASTGAHEASEFGCAACRGSRPSWDVVVRLGSYAHPIDSWIQEVKFDRAHLLGVDLGRCLGARIQTILGAPDPETVVVPVPTTARRRAGRGIDHALRIAQGVGSSLGLRVVRGLKRAHRPSQRSVAPSARAKNVFGAFRMARSEQLTGRPVILVDDVMTSGATLRAAARALRGPSGCAGLVVGVVGVTPAPERREGLGDGADALKNPDLSTESRSGDSPA